MTHRLRLVLLIVAGVLLALVLAAFIAVRVLLQPDRFTRMLRDNVQAAGLQLSLGAPAEPTLWPKPAVVLHDMSISVHGRPLLLAARGRLVLPWHVLLGGPATITRLELDLPRLDIAALPEALAQMPHPASAGVPDLPRIEAGVVLNDASLVLGERMLLQHMHAQTGILAPNSPFELQLAAQTASGRACTFTLTMTPHRDGTALVFDNLRLSAYSGPQFSTLLHGQARWGGGADVRMNLDGNLQRAPGDAYQLALHLVPASADAPFLLHLKIAGSAVNADLSLPPLAAAQWWKQVAGANAAAPLPLPPLDGHAEAEQLDVGDLHVEGLQLRAGSALPAAASSAPAVASSSPIPAQ